MTAPFVGAIFGGFIYDTLVFTGDSPLNRRHFGLDEWRWRRGVNDIVENVAEVLPDAMVPDALMPNQDGRSSSSSTAEVHKDRGQASPSSHEKTDQLADFSDRRLPADHELHDASQQNMPSAPHLGASGRTNSI